MATRRTATPSTDRILSSTVSTPPTFPESINTSAANSSNTHSSKLTKSSSPHPPTKLSPGGFASTGVPTSTVLKLLLFTFLMVTCPISAFFLTRSTIYAGNVNANTWAGGTAAVVANVVLAAYVVVAVMEDGGEEELREKKE